MIGDSNSACAIHLLLTENIDRSLRFCLNRCPVITSPRRISTPPGLRNVLCLLLFIAAGIAVLSAISSSRAIAQRADGAASLLTAVASTEATKGDGWDRVDVFTAASAMPPAGPPCTPSPCWQPVDLSEHFDSVTPPGLPPDWIATNAQGSPPFWVTSDSGVPKPPADTAPNAAFIDDPAVVSDKRLDWLLSVPPANLSLTFRHNFNLEASDEDPNLGFDGGALEISTDGGNTFQDILTAGGSFAMGGYNRTISSDRGSPIAGRQAWSGNSQGFITTVVNLPFVLPPISALRWRMASDTSGSNEGWRVDTVDIVGCAPIPCPTPTPPITPTPSVTPTVTPTGTPTVTPTATPTATASPRVTPRSRPTPHPRPSPP